jgi:hypothetical protein
MYIQKKLFKLYVWIKNPNENYIQVEKSQNKSKSKNSLMSTTSLKRKIEMLFSSSLHVPLYTC